MCAECTLMIDIRPSIAGLTCVQQIIESADSSCAICGNVITKG